MISSDPPKQARFIKAGLADTAKSIGWSAFMTTTGIVSVNSQLFRVSSK